MIHRLARTRIDKTISLVRGPRIYRLPLTIAHQVHVHVKRRHIYARGDCISLGIHSVPHRERPRRNERHAGRWAGVIDSTPCERIGDRHLEVVNPVGGSSDPAGYLDSIYAGVSSIGPGKISVWAQTRDVDRKSTRLNSSHL